MRCQPFQPVSFTGCKVKPTARALSGYVGCVLTPCGTTWSCRKVFFVFPPRPGWRDQGSAFCRMYRKKRTGLRRQGHRPYLPIKSYEAEPVFLEKRGKLVSAACLLSRCKERRSARPAYWFGVLALHEVGPGPTDPPQGGGFSGRNTRLERPERVAGKMEIRNDDSWQ